MHISLETLKQIRKTWSYLDSACKRADVWLILMSRTQHVILYGCFNSKLSCIKKIFLRVLYIFIT